MSPVPRQPLSLLNQWAEEIEEKCEANQFSCLIYHGKNRDGVRKVKHILKYDVVLTTYHTLLGEFADEESAVKNGKKAAKANNDAGNEDNYIEQKEKGLLYKVPWYRVVLDEARELLPRIVWSPEDDDSDINSREQTPFAIATSRCRAALRHSIRSSAGA